ncbi:hypothetical protein HDU96_009774 [Phlyctochytrium bullatum]|nr:hypothetical protein HDU96_009774 [Phlyctochytrium bullatum]
MGGFMQPQGHVQVLLNILHFGKDPQEALDQPRFCIAPFSTEGLVDVEVGVSETTVAALRALGHKVRVLEGSHRSTFGRGQVVRVRKDEDSPTGLVMSAGSDPRADGMAVPAAL